jgi:acyl-CoA synthetase (AMP-forming)/AMP-acid ligase II
VWLGGTAGPGLVGELSRARATVLPAVPTLAATLARLLDRHRGAVPPLRLLTNTGAAMPAATLSRLRAAVPGLGVQLMFGLTECKRVSIMEVDGDLHHPGSGGRPLPGTEVRVVDDHGAPVPNGTTGELVVIGPHVMSGYWRRPEETARRFVRRDGLFPELHTGDYGWLDDDGYLYFAGRRDDLYKSRGFRVSTVEVEAAACRVDGVRAAAVLTPGPGRADAVLVVVAASGPGDMLAGLRRELEDFKVPATCVCLDALPTNGNGKIDKQALAAALDREPVDVG